MKSNKLRRNSRASPQTDDDFLTRCGISGEDQSRALGIRAAVAKLSGLDPRNIHHDDRLMEDLGGFWDSLDSVEMVMEIEEQLGITISDEVAEKIKNPEFYPEYLVMDLVLQTLAVLRAEGL